jgi:outer membrane receptor protein involved in Fe transport
MKRILILITIICSFLSAKAQFGVGGGSTIVGRISGTVIDSLTKQPLDYATVAIYRSTGKSPINGVVTDEKGNFKLDNIHPGEYKLVISFIGYPGKTVTGVTTTPAKPDKNVGMVLLAPATKALKEVNVTAAAPLIENRIDKIVYNAEKDLTAAGGNAADVLQKVPLVSVDINGNVSIRGDQNVKVLINGRPSGITSTSLSDALKAIPADQIKSIEVITSPSAKYDAEGSAGIINIITKSKNVSGVSGGFSGGIGTKQNNGNLNFNYNKNRFSFSTNLSGNLTWPQTTPTDFMQSTVKGDTVSSTHYHSTSDVKRHALMGTATATYAFNDFNTITSNFRLNGGGFDINGTQNDQVQSNKITSANAAYMGNSISNTTLTGFDWSADYDHKFKKPGHDIDVSAQWSHSIIDNNYLYNYTAVNPSQKGFNNGTNDEYTLQADYTLPISKLLKLEAGGKSIFRRLSSDYDNYNLTNGNYIFDPINSNNYTYNQDVYAGYTVLTFTLPKSYSVLAGARYEDTEIDGLPNNPLQSNLTTFHSSYGVFIPSLTLQKQINASNTIKLSYSKRIQRPSLQFLNPFLNTSRIQSQSQGNPELKPEISQTIELNYNAFIKSSLLNFSVYYKSTSSHIEGIARPISYVNGTDTLPATLTTYENIGKLHSWGASFFGSVTPIKILTIRSSITAYTFNPDPSTAYMFQQSTNGTYIQYFAFVSSAFTFNHGLIAEAFLVDKSAEHTIQGTNPGFYYYSFGVRKQFDNKKASIGLNMVNPFSYYENFNSTLKSPGFTQSSYTQFPFRSFGVTFSYSFGKTTFSNPTGKQKGVNNDDLKQGDQGGLGGGAPGGGSGGGAPGGR